LLVLGAGGSKMALKEIGLGSTGRLPSEKWEGGTDQLFLIDHTGGRAGQTIGPDGEPVGGILIGCLYIPTRRLVGFTRSDENGDYSFDGLRAGSADYFFFAFPDAQKFGGVYPFAT